MLLGCPDLGIEGLPAERLKEKKAEKMMNLPFNDPITSLHSH